MLNGVLVFLLFHPDGVTADTAFVKKEQGRILEQRTYSPDRTLKTLITYDAWGSRPVDSVVMDKAGHILVYGYNNGRYHLKDSLLYASYYESYFVQHPECSLNTLVTHRLLLEETLYNLCSIQQSVVPGEADNSISTVSTDSSGECRVDIKTFGAIYSFLPMDIKAFFYDRPLKRLICLIKDGYLLQEHYEFNNGTYIRRYHYLDGWLRRVEISVQNNDLKKIRKHVIQQWESE